MVVNGYEEKIQDERKRFSSEKLFPNTMLLGATCSGKSSLINFVFGKRLAHVNDGLCGTIDFMSYWGRDHGKNINLIDSRGYEMEGSFSSYYSSIREKIEESQKGDPLMRIHAVWLCISIAAGRIHPYDIQIIKELQNDPELRKRIAVLFTKSDVDDEDGSIAKTFKQVLTSEVGYNLPIFKVSTYPDSKYDLEDVVAWSATQLDDTVLAEDFIAVHMMDLESKRKSVAIQVGLYSAAAAAIAVVPIPVAASAILTPLQVAMATHIIHVYGMDNLTAVTNALLGDVIVANLGKMLAGELIKLVPFAGQIINASVASLITGALGFAISEICYDSCKKIAKGEYVDFSKAFDAETIHKYSAAYMESHKHRNDRRSYKNHGGHKKK